MSDSPPIHSHSSPGIAAKAFDREQFESALEQAYQTLRLIAAAEVGRNDADDIVHEATLVAMRKFEQFVPGTNFQAWMASIIRGVASNTRRGEHRSKKKLQRFSILRATTETRNAVLLKSEQRESIQIIMEQCFSQLSADQRSCLLLRVIRGHSYREVAEISGISESTARSHVSRARQRLLELVPPEEGD